MVFCRGEASNDLYRYIDTYGEFPAYVLKSSSHKYYYEGTLDKADRLEKKKEAIRIKEAKAQAILDAKPTALEFHSKVEALLGVLPTGDLSDLRKRGLSTRTMRFQGYRTIKQYVNFSIDLSGVPGFKPNGSDYQYIGKSGIICPLRDLNNRITGFQIKTNIQEMKYVWTSTKGEVELNYRTKVGEFPLGIAKGANDKIIGFCEGVLKHVVASDRLGISMIGTISNSQHQAPTLMRQYLKAYPSSQYTAVIYPDAGGVANRNVTSHELQNVRLLKQLGYKVLFADWGHWFDKTASDCDELNSSVVINYREERFYRSAIDKQGYPVFAEEPITADNLVAGEVNYAHESQNEGDLYEAAFQSDFKFFLSTSPTGSGKSYHAYNCEKPEGATVHYTATSQRKADIDAARHVKRLPSRNDGTDIKEGEVLGTIMTANNCHLTKQHHKAKALNMTSDSVCSTCVFAKECKTSFGEGYGFKHQRSQALGHPQLRVNYHNLQTKNVESRKGLKIGFFDEISRGSLIKEQIIKKDNLIQKWNTIGFFIDDYPKEVKVSKAIVSYLVGICNELENDTEERYGYTGGTIVSKLKDLRESVMEIGEDKLFAFANMVSQEQEKTNFSAYGQTFESKAIQAQQVWFEDFIKGIFSRHTTHTANLEKFWISKKVDGKDVTTPCSRLVIRKRNDELRDRILSYDKIIMQDATAITSELIGFLDIKKEDLVILQTGEPNYNNVKVETYDVNTNTDQDDKKYQLVLDTVDRIKVKYADRRKGGITYKANQKTKRALDALDMESTVLTHFSDARGSNELSKAEVIICVGSARPNIGALLCRQNILHNTTHSKDDKEFHEYYKEVCTAETMQEIGRLRQQWRPDKELVFCLISHNVAELPLINNIKNYSRQECGGKLRGSNLRDSFQKAYLSVMALCQKPTRENIASMLDISTRTLSRMAKEAGNDFKGLIAMFTEMFSPNFTEDNDHCDPKQELDTTDDCFKIPVTIEGISKISRVFPALEPLIVEKVESSDEFKLIGRELDHIKEHVTSVIEAFDKEENFKESKIPKRGILAYLKRLVFDLKGNPAKQINLIEKMHPAYRDGIKVFVGSANSRGSYKLKHLLYANE